MHCCECWAVAILSSKKIMAYMPNLVWMFVSGTYLAIPGELKVANHHVLAYICKILGLYPHVACWLSQLYLELVAIFVQ